MILKYIILENIRSYINQRIDFPQGSILLSGDIGSGKSTILLSIEFALFGLLRGEISGASLLRNGGKNGTVELCFESDNNEIIIKRILKRNSKGIEQDAGYIILNNLLKECTPVELKSEVLKILGYPSELISKNKNIIYRYTVFTPQEEMKRILFDNEDERINILRKVFGIDKYKIIKENCEIYIRLLREKRRNLEGKIFDLEEKLKKITDLSIELESLDKESIKEKNSLQSIKEFLGRKKSEIEVLQNRFEALKEQKQQLAASDNELRKNNELKRRFIEEEEKIRKNIIELEREISSVKFEKTSIEEINLTKKSIAEKEESLQNYLSETAQLKARIEDSENTKNQIQSINTCLLCLQEVSSEHKKRITGKENESLKINNEKLATISGKKKQAENELKELTKNLEIKQKNLQFSELSNIKARLLDEKKERLKQALFEIQEIDKINQLLKEKTEALKKELEKFSLIEIHLSDLKKDIETISIKDRSKEMEVNKILEKIILNKKIFNDLEKEITEKKGFKAQIDQINNLEYWLKEYFISLTDLIERHVMSRIYQEFNELFKEWFSILIEDELLTVQLNDSFTPIIQQNGYDTDIESLSGGEKTACALAYRLALNKVINGVISTINTKNIIMLDEPTDGFSSHQLDKIKDVLNELRIKQIIIVSHEQKIESFVDNVIRISKNNHVSEIEVIK